MIAPLQELRFWKNKYMHKDSRFFSRDVTEVFYARLTFLRCSNVPPLVFMLPNWPSFFFVILNVFSVQKSSYALTSFFMVWGTRICCCKIKLYEESQYRLVATRKNTQHFFYIADSTPKNWKKLKQIPFRAMLYKITRNIVSSWWQTRKRKFKQW